MEISIKYPKIYENIKKGTKKRMAETLLVKPFSMVLETGIEPVRLYGARDFKKAYPLITLHYPKLYKVL